METFTSDSELNLLPPADLAGEIERLQEELSAERDRNLRTLADFKNYRRRVESDGNKIADESKRKLMIPLLDIIDDLEKALSSAHDDEQPALKGVKNIHRKFLALLESHGVVPFESVGTIFDHNLHEAVAVTTRKVGKPGIVADELRRGYLWNNELLRHAQVRVTG